MICLAHLKFALPRPARASFPALRRCGIRSQLPVLAFLGLILVIMYFSEGIRILRLTLMPLWVGAQVRVYADAPQRRQALICLLRRRMARLPLLPR